jgi:riboflavin biosynthesis pyrimidine reductase
VTDATTVASTGADDARIDALWPVAAEDLDDDAVLAAYESGVARDWLRVNFVSSVDGSATLSGRAGGLGDPADRRVFALLRRPCEVVLVGAGTVRAEGYSGELVDAATRRWREAHGLAPHPRLAIVSQNLALEPDSEVFTRAPERTLVITSESAPPDRRAALAEVAEVVACGEASVDPRVVLRALAARGLRRVQCEGGPRLFGTFADAGAVDELCLTLSPLVVVGDGPRIATGIETELGLRLARVLRSGDTLLLRYVRR